MVCRGWMPDSGAGFGGGIFGSSRNSERWLSTYCFASTAIWGNTFSPVDLPPAPVAPSSGSMQQHLERGVETIPQAQQARSQSGATAFSHVPKHQRQSQVHRPAEVANKEPCMVPLLGFCLYCDVHKPVETRRYNFHKDQVSLGRE